MARKLEHLNLNFDDPSVEETEMHQRMAEEIELDELYQDYSREEMHAKYSLFLISVRQSGINVENIFANIPTKIRHLKEIMGYTGLTGRKNRMVSFRDAKASRIGRAYLKTYNIARKICND